VQIDELPDYFIDDVLIVPSICFGESSGSIQVSDVDAVVYSNIESAETNATGYFPNLPAGVYNLSVTNVDGCIADTVVAFGSVSGPIDIVPDFTEQQVCYLDTVSFSALAAGGSGGFTYNWYNCASVDNTCDLGLGDPLQIEITQDTTLYVVAFDANGCPSAPAAMWVHFNPQIYMNVDPGDIVYICQEECVDLETGAAGGNGNISVEWTDATDPLNPVLITDTYTTTQCPMDTALYVVTGNDGCNPPGIDSVLVIVWPKPEAIMEVSAMDGCFPTTIDFTNLTDTIYQDDCLWLLGNGSQLGVCSDFSFTYTVEGEYWPSLTVTTQYGCTDTDSLDLPIQIHGYPEAFFTWEPQPVTVLENEVQFIDLSVDDVAWIWDFGGFGHDDVENPVFEFPDVDLWNYPICLEVINEFGCIDTACRTLVMGSILLVYVPNAFTPDDDDVNDYFLPYVRGFEPGSYKLFIYDRWGNRIFYTEDVDQPWTCNVRDGEYYAQNDVYVWRIELKELGTAAEKVFSGHVTVVR
jgi:gliding motility-associated-like protein